MKVFLVGWPQSLAAVTLAAVLFPTSGAMSQAVAAEDEHHVPRITVEREGEHHPAEAAKKEQEGTHREARETPREERKVDAHRERAQGREGGEEREARTRELAQRRGHLQEQAAEIRGKLEALKPDQDAAARDLREALERIELQLRELPSPAPDRERLQARLEELKAAHQRAREAGNTDEAERLEREARELMGRAQQRPGEGAGGRPEGDEVQRRMQHLRMAIENLRAAGLNDQAEALTRDAERLARGERSASPEGGRRAEGARDVPAAVPQLERAVQELRGQVQELRQQLEEIRQHLKAGAEKR